MYMYMYIYLKYVYIYVYMHIAGNVPQCSICRWVVSVLFFFNLATSPMPRIPTIIRSSPFSHWVNQLDG